MKDSKFVKNNTLQDYDLKSTVEGGYFFSQLTRFPEKLESTEQYSLFSNECIEFCDQVIKKLNHLKYLCLDETGNLKKLKKKHFSAKLTGGTLDINFDPDNEKINTYEKFEKSVNDAVLIIEEEIKPELRIVKDSSITEKQQ